MTDSESIQRLIDEFGYSDSKAKMIWQKISDISPDLYAVFNAWWENGKPPEITEAGISYSELISKHSMNPLAAFLTLDWLKRDPAAASAAIRRGHDRVVIK